MSATRATALAALASWALAALAATLWLSAPAPTMGAGTAPASVVEHLDTSDRPAEPTPHTRIL